MKRLPIVTTRDARLSLWTSIAESRLKQRHPELSLAQIRGLPMMRGIYAHILETQGKKAEGLTAEISGNAEKSKQFYAIYREKLIAYIKEHNADKPLTLATEDETRDYSDADDEWYALGAEWLAEITAKLPESEAWYDEVGTIIGEVASADTVIAEWAFTRKSVQTIQQQIVEYRPWTSHSYSDIAWKLPNDAKVVMLGDWGTSLDDAKQLLKAIWQNTNPDAFVHLGDIYYSGSKTECQDNFLDVFSQVATELNKKMVPIFTIPGNHEYYSFGEGFYWMLDNMNKGSYKVYDRKQNDISSQCTQSASYFRLQTEDGKWQFLGMDTGQDDNNPAVTHFYPVAPILMGDQDSAGEYSWHKDKLDNFKGQTILMSHHQLFTRSNNIIDKYAQPYLNGYLYGYFAPYFNKIAAWFWGHEHSFALYEDGIYGLAKGRLLGSSSYEEAVSNGPYDNLYPLVPYKSASEWKVPTVTDGFYDHACAVFDFARANPGDPITITYYGFPSWGQGETMPPDANLYFLASDSIGPSTMPGISWQGNKKIDSQSGLSDIQCKGTPALASYGNTMHLVYRTDSDTDTLHYAKASVTAQGATWSDDSGLDGASTCSPGCCCDSNGLLWVFFADKADKDRLRYFTIDSKGNQGDTQSAKDSNGNHAHPISAISAVWKGATLYVAFTESVNKEDRIRIASFDGTDWTYSYPSGNPVTKYGPALAVFSDNLYLVYADQSLGNQLVFQTCNSKAVWSNAEYCNNSTSSEKMSMPQAYGNVSLVAEKNGRLTVVYQGADNAINWLTYDPVSTFWWGNIAVPRLNGNEKPPLTKNSTSACALSNGIYICFSGRSSSDIRWVRRIDNP